jgi:hypothetical protein
LCNDVYYPNPVQFGKKYAKFRIDKG